MNRSNEEDALKTLLRGYVEPLTDEKLQRQVWIEGQWEEWKIRQQNFNEAWNKKVQALNSIREAKQESFERKKKETADSFNETARRIQEKFERMKEKEEEEKAYPFSQRMQDLSDRWDERTKKDWEKHKNTTLTQWGWVKESPPSQEDNKDSVQRK